MFIEFDSATPTGNYLGGANGAAKVDLSLFQPDATTTVLAVTAASARTALPAGVAVRLSNAGDVAISVRFGDSTVTAATTAMDILPGSAEVFRVPTGATHLAAIVASGTGTLKITAGSGA